MSRAIQARLGAGSRVETKEQEETGPRTQPVLLDQLRAVLRSQDLLQGHTSWASCLTTPHP